MNKIQKRFFQFLMKVKICPQELAIDTLDIIYGNQDDQQDFCQFISGINNVIKKFDIEVVTGRSELSGQEFVALIQLCDKNANQPTKSIAKKSSDFFSRLISAIAISHRKKISEKDALNIGTMSGLNKGATKASLSTMQKNEWLELDASGQLFLGVRTIMELGPCIASHYPNCAKSCALCRKNVFYGTVCAGCGSATHKPCALKFSKQKGSNKCVSCNDNLDPDQDMEMDTSDDSVRAMSASFVSEPSTSYAMPTPPKRPRLK